MSQIDKSLQPLDFSRTLSLFLQPPFEPLNNQLIVGSCEDTIDFSIY